MDREKYKYWVSEEWPNGDEARNIYFSTLENLKEWLVETNGVHAHMFYIYDISDPYYHDNIYRQIWGKIEVDKLNLRNLT